MCVAVCSTGSDLKQWNFLVHISLFWNDGTRSASTAECRWLPLTDADTSVHILVRYISAAACNSALSAWQYVSLHVCSRDNYVQSIHKDYQKLSGDLDGALPSWHAAIHRFVERLAQRSPQYRSFNWHFWQTSQITTVFCFMRLHLWQFDFYVLFINALTYLLTYLLTYMIIQKLFSHIFWRQMIFYCKSYQPHILAHAIHLYHQYITCKPVHCWYCLLIIHDM